MSSDGWYLDKADQCARMARAAADRDTRAHYEQEAKLWREIAADIAKNERSRFGSDSV
jgi:hypothetical protein